MSIALERPLPIVDLPAGTRPELVQYEPDYARELETALRGAIEGEVRFDKASRGAYSTDSSNYRQIPIGVIVPKTTDDVVETIAVCRRFGAPITSRGGGTSLAGQCCNVAIVIDWSKYLRHVLSIDPQRRTARVQPGCVLDHLRHTAEDKYGLTFGPDPATHSHNTLGGMIGNDSCGIHSVMAQLYGPGPRTQHNVESLEVLTYGGERMRVGPTSDEQLHRVIAQGGRQGEIYRQLRDLRDRYATLIRERFPNIPRRVSGYSLDCLLPENGFNVAQALVGSEGTCVTVLEATVKLIDQQPERALLVLGYPDVFEAGDHIMEIMEHRPVGLEGMDDVLVKQMQRKGLHPHDADLLPPGGGWLLVEFGGASRQEARDKAQAAMDAIRRQKTPPSMKLLDDRWQEQKLWEVRESGLGATAHVPGVPSSGPGWEDAAVAPEHVGKYLRDFRSLLNAYQYQCALYGHFGQGCVHCRISFDLKTPEGVARFTRFLDAAADLVLKYGGSLSGEHGDGQARATLLPKMFGPELVEAFREFKTIWDPQWKMNPGKVVDPYPPDANLRVGPSNYHPAQTDVYFSYPRDHGSFSDAANRCVGVGKCRRNGDGTMCPSYMVTHEEIHSTRGRARLLFEMLESDVVTKGWRDEAVHEALDLCLACKGCKNECPVNVDMATYKAEFLAHYYDGRLRPRAAYAMGWIYWWARLASHLPRVANFFSQTWPFSSAAKWVAGISPHRRLPPFATETFVHWFRHRHLPSVARQSSESRRPATEPITHGDVPDFQTDTYSHDDELRILNPYAKRSRTAGRRVMLWPDTFTNYLKPEAGKAAVHVLEDAGFNVVIPARPLCCGRPLYDFGMLDAAKRLWQQTIGVLHEEIYAGTPVVGLEPSCVAAFRDELVNLFPGDGAAKRLSQQTYLLSEFLEQEGYQPPRIERKAIVHGHCHHKAIMHMDAEVSLLKKMGLDYDVLDSGCCGMAGSFGFEKEKYDVSVACGERVLLPAVRAADHDTLLIANGFSCREQIEQCTERRAMHVAEVLDLALRDEQGFERQMKPQKHSLPRAAVYSMIGLGGGLIAGALLAKRWSSSRPIR
jgi:FAD/FMN-containing dehydrogenase/Fe-S oxidoreductase